jgi:hypothetical protein
MRLHLLVCLTTAIGAAAASTCPDRDREIYQARTFFGYDCDSGCAPEKAGFSWAERHGITSPEACAAADPALDAGCRAFASLGASSFDAGYAWALENEVADLRLCNGGGGGFRRGCRRYVGEAPGRQSVRCAEAWPGRAEAFPAATPGR